MSEKLFPPYLNVGSTGPAVAALQIFLIGNGNNPKIVVDGNYAGETVAGVKNLQEELDMEGDDVDGNFGPATRAALKAEWNIDFDAFPADIFSGETVGVGP